MNAIRHFKLRNIPARNPVRHYQKHLEISQCCLYSSSSSRTPKSSSSSSSSDSDDPKKADPKEKSEEKIKKLNELLLKLVQQDEVVSTPTKLDLAKPIGRTAKSKDIEPKQENEEVKLSKAVKDIAKLVGGDIKQTQSELLMKLKGSPETAQDNSMPTKSLSDIVKGMKIDRETKTVEQTRADEIRMILSRVQSQPKKEPKRDRQVRRPARSQPKSEIVMKPIDLFGNDPLGIFTNKSELQELPVNKTWDMLYNRDLKLAVTHPPANYFQEMILWTEQGKLWTFPIDNEQGLDKEKKIYFTQHIFLEEHLEPWCPPKGPIRNFMELVCVGLSKNPYFTVEQKKEHIDWFKNYFMDKKTLLQEIGAMSVDKT